MWGLAAFGAGFAVAIVIFLRALMHTSGFRAIPLFARIAGRASIVSIGMFGLFAVFTVVGIGVILVPSFIFAPETFPTATDLESFTSASAIIGTMLTLLLIFVPVYVFFLAQEAARFKMRISSNIDMRASSIILGVFFTGIWLGSEFDSGLMAMLTVITFFFFLSFTTEKQTPGSARVSGIERWTLFAAVCIALYTFLSNGFDSVYSIVFAGYVFGSVIVRLVTIFLPQHGGHSQQVHTTKSWKDLRPRLTIFILTGAIIAMNYYGGFASMVALVGFALILADALTVRDKHGFASVSVNWAELEKTKMPSAWSQLRPKGIR